MLNAHFTTSEGNFTVRLFDEDVPNTVANFVGLADVAAAFAAGGIIVAICSDPHESFELRGRAQLAARQGFAALQRHS